MAGNSMDSSQREWVLSILEQYEARLVRYAQRLTGDEHAALDIVQHAFLKLCDQPPDEFRHGVGAWLYAVCRNRAIDQQRKERRMESYGDVQELARPSFDLGPAERCEALDVGQQLRVAVQSLKSDQQEVVDLWSEGFSYREISRITSRNESTIRVQVHRALKQIREHPIVRQLLEAADVAAES